MNAGNKFNKFQFFISSNRSATATGPKEEATYTASEASGLHLPKSATFPTALSRSFDATGS